MKNPLMPIVKLILGGSSSSKKKKYRYEVRTKNAHVSFHYTKKTADVAARKFPGAWVVPIGARTKTKRVGIRTRVRRASARKAGRGYSPKRARRY